MWTGLDSYSMRCDWTIVDIMEVDGEGVRSILTFIHKLVSKMPKGSTSFFRTIVT